MKKARKKVAKKASITDLVKTLNKVYGEFMCLHSTVSFIQEQLADRLRLGEIKSCAGCGCIGFEKDMSRPPHDDSDEIKYFCRKCIEPVREDDFYARHKRMKRKVKDRTWESLE